ncbi:MRP-L47-domain-containing protein [Ascobolus immersus RN42]|uniref:Large ribosomal subunit protein uL29m n=1 Tax=Ascobolus immersus RN42 TaxID=1160509 RepID=A0A3N4ILB8_ASCIM|nr:MRP-L47-domain-containing protein [Ascobolus immersus RN42]
MSLPLVPRAIRSRAIPTVTTSSATQCARAFSTTPANAGRNSDRSKLRGISALHRTNPKAPLLAMSKIPLPQPVLDKAKHTPIITAPDHGLWDFFPTKSSLRTPEEDASHGRAWHVSELRNKSFEDLHKLWYICVKERNVIATQAHERDRLKPGYGDFEAQTRDKTVKKTMSGIRNVLIERHHAWTEARRLAKSDPEVDLSGQGRAYRPAAPSFAAEPVEQIAAKEVATEEASPAVEKKAKETVIPPPTPKTESTVSPLS